MKAPLYEQIYQHILAEIDAGRLKPGSRVLSEKELAQQFHVSRITSKRALEKLAQDGRVVRARGRGSFVAPGAAPLVAHGDGDAPAGDSEPGKSEPRRGEAGRGETGRGEALPLVGFLVPDISDTFGAHMLRTIEDELRRRGMRLVLCRTQGQRDLEDQAIEDCLALGVVGMVVFPVYGEYYNEHLLRLVLDRFPLVLVDRYLRGIPACSVSTDNARAAEDLTNRLIELGHRRIAFVSPPPAGTSSIEERTLGVMAAMAGHGLPFDAETDVVYTRCTLPGAVTPSTPSRELVAHDLEALTAFMRARRDVTAYIVCEYTLAVLTLRALAALGLRTPQDVAVACFDSPGTPLDDTSITHVQQDEESMGRQAVELLAAHLRGEPAQGRKIAPHVLVPGATTALREHAPIGIAAFAK